MIKIITEGKGNLTALPALFKLSSFLASANYAQKLLLFDGSNGSFRTIKLRAKQSSCAVCSKTPQITSLIDYVQFCGAGANDKTASLTILGDEQRISCAEYKRLVSENTSHVLFDVRETVQFEICSLPNAISSELFSDESPF